MNFEQRRTAELKNAYSCLISNNYGMVVSTGCKAFDALLEGGILRGSLTDICGGAGTGKTQLAIQIMLESILSREKTDLEFKAIYISTQKTLHEKRFNEMKTEFFKKYQIPSYKDVIAYVNSIHAPTLKDFEIVINKELPLRFQNKEKIKTIVIDSIASLCTEFSSMNPALLQQDAAERNTFLRQLASSLKALAFNNQICVITINNMVSAIAEDDKISKKDKLLPALGQSWTSYVNERIILKKFAFNIKEEDDENQMQQAPRRVFKISLSSRLKGGKVLFVIKNFGLGEAE